MPDRNPLDGVDPIEFLEEQLELPKGSFMAHVTAPDDWTMVLKIHAMLGAALNLALREEKGGRFKGFRSHNVPLGIHSGSGKTALALGLGLLDEASAKKMDSLTDLRNVYAHNPRSATKTIAEIVPLSKHPNLLERHLALPSRMLADVANKWRTQVVVASLRVLNTLVNVRLEQPVAAATDATFNDQQLTDAVRNSRRMVRAGSAAPWPTWSSARAVDGSRRPSARRGNLKHTDGCLGYS